MIQNKNFIFDFERLNVYPRALEFTNKAFYITKELPHILQYSLGDQFRRATLSTCNNIAEGSGKQTKSAKIKFYGYSMDSACEYIPMLSIAFKQNLIKSVDYDYVRQECKKICNTLGDLISAAKH